MKNINWTAVITYIALVTISSSLFYWMFSQIAKLF